MTVTYTADVATCRGLGCFWRLLFRWRGSIYKLLWPNLIVYSVLYFGLSFVYRSVLNKEQRLWFEKLSLHCQVYGDLIPVSFVLGFYVSIVIKRWWDQYACMPWPDNLALLISSLVQGHDERGRLMRRTILRYVNLCLVLTLRAVSPRVKKRFPTHAHLVEAGFMLPNELKIFENMAPPIPLQDRKSAHLKYWMPLVWAASITTRARKEGRVRDDFALKTIIDELNAFRAGCGGMLNYDWISIPLVYTQVVTLAVYIYFLATLMGNQYLDPSKGYLKHEIDLVIPVFTFLQFFFYMGWLKVAESLVNPFGEDDDDFEVNWLIDRNLQVSYMIVDEMHAEHPELVKDQYWEEVFPASLPYTAAARQYHTGPPQYSAAKVEVSPAGAEFLPVYDNLKDSPKSILEEDIEEVEGDVMKPNSGCGSHPVRIRSRLLTFSESGSRRRSSALSMLARLFRHSESGRDLEEHLSSSLSLRSQGGLRSCSRVSSASRPSRASLLRTDVTHDEMFKMSDISLPLTPLPVKTEGSGALPTERAKGDVLLKDKELSESGSDIVNNSGVDITNTLLTEVDPRTLTRKKSLPTFEPPKIESSSVKKELVLGAARAEMEMHPAVSIEQSQVTPTIVAVMAQPIVHVFQDAKVNNPNLEASIVLSPPKKLIVKKPVASGLSLSLRRRTSTESHASSAGSVGSLDSDADLESIITIMAPTPDFSASTPPKLSRKMRKLMKTALARPAGPPAHVTTSVTASLDMRLATSPIDNLPSLVQSSDAVCSLSTAKMSPPRDIILGVKDIPCQLDRLSLTTITELVPSSQTSDSTDNSAETISRPVSPTQGQQYVPTPAIPIPPSPTPPPPSPSSSTLPGIVPPRRGFVQELEPIIEHVETSIESTTIHIAVPSMEASKFPDSMQD